MKKSELRQMIREEYKRAVNEANISPAVTKLMNKLADFSGELHGADWDLDASKRSTLKQAIELTDRLKKLVKQLA